MRQPYKPVIPMMAIRATADEMIALGWVITHYLQYLERSAQKTQEHRELIGLLRSFQARVVKQGAFQREGQQ
ncbi:hypothetical protein KSF_097920 [Reticulibacter mediterranei]|uniref:Uncharacterized protein n=1 Tax=Reticulibacter mediterranei TaxID=2778369 RepID=A0A8J3N635_9CHLR|nr:hypothetical protein [Reticulibacter mediterranei]GHO99744.1 hypothetical protein KSF_097920 [Reticulibacter mediterranei]